MDKSDTLQRNRVKHSKCKKQRDYTKRIWNQCVEREREKERLWVERETNLGNKCYIRLGRKVRGTYVVGIILSNIGW